MLTEERFTRILSILESMGSVTVQQLMTELDASESTIRRDLNTLDANGQLIKVHGGAILKNTAYSTEDDEVMQRRERNKGAKEKIAQYAAGLIGPGDFVYIDAGTTTDLMIDFITARQAVFVTNAITHAKKLAQKGCTVYILGGEFKAITEAIVGEEAVSSVEKYNFTKGLAESKEHLVFILWGSYAQKKGAFIDRNKHLVLTSAHPSPLSAYNGFFGNKHFSRTNDYLKAHGETEINW